MFRSKTERSDAGEAQPAALGSRVKHSTTEPLGPYKDLSCICSDFIWNFGKLPFPSHLGKYVIKIGKISTKIHEIGKTKAIFGLGMTPK